MIWDSNLPIIKRANDHNERIAIIDKTGEYSYHTLVDSAQHVSAWLLDGNADLREARVAFMVPSSFEYPVIQWAIWQAGGIAVPLCTTHPVPEIDYVLEDTGTEIIVAHPDFEEKLRPLASRHNIRFLSTSDIIYSGKSQLPYVDLTRRAMILYTSGTTNKPKGVVSTHQNVTTQIKTLIDAWEWKADDHILDVLPLHHTHGIINILLCALWAGASCEMVPKFDAEQVLKRFATGDLTLFMAVPTIYYKLIEEWENASQDTKNKISQGCEKMRLMVSGSAALPVSILEKWKTISGHTLLERYGMTEISMAISNPLHGDRRPGFVGKPLPRIEVRLVDENGEETAGENNPGEIQVRGENVFMEYWGKPKATRESFSKNWFCTGDMAVIEKGYYRILGRSSVDIIKTGGYKVSALEIEEVLRTHPGIAECAVIGVEDEEWGERICAAVVPTKDTSLSLEDLREWAKERLAHYKTPTRLLLLNELPRNIMGKVTKPEVKKLFQ